MNGRKAVNVTHAAGLAPTTQQGSVQNVWSRPDWGDGWRRCCPLDNFLSHGLVVVTQRTLCDVEIALRGRLMREAVAVDVR